MQPKLGARVPLIPGEGRRRVAYPKLKTFGVSPRTVKNVERIRKKSPELFQQVHEGALSGPDAAFVARLTKREQERLIAEGPDAIKAAMSAHLMLPACGRCVGASRLIQPA